MKRFALLFAVVAFGIVVPAQADKPPHPSHPNPGKGHTCTARDEGYLASGTLVSASLTPTATKGRFNGMLSVNVTQANHDAATGTQSFTLTNVRVYFGKGVSSTSPAPGSRVRLHGTITVLPHGCSTTGFTATTTIHKVGIQRPK